MEEIKKVHLGDIGIVFRIGITDENGVVQIQACTTKQIIFRKPDDTSIVKTAEFYTDGSDGYMQYTSITGDLNQAGIWHIQGYVELPNQSFHTDIDSFLIIENLEEVS